MIISALLMVGGKRNDNYEKAVIEQKARSMGMEYPEEMRVMPSKKGSK
ncbi:hypothetical protein [Haloimpatiens lingqiaonensis]|nr:hypothetical protein [Haloimpatiens lingqiaonensis]